jgi:hypothetical protein
MPEVRTTTLLWNSFIAKVLTRNLEAKTGPIVTNLFCPHPANFCFFPSINLTKISILLEKFAKFLISQT